MTRRILCYKLYVMNTKLTLRMDKALVLRAKSEAKNRGKSVSRMVGEFIDSLSKVKSTEQKLPPVTASLVGLLRGRRVSEADYKKHLRERYL